MEDHVHTPEDDGTRRLTVALLITGIFILMVILRFNEYVYAADDRQRVSQTTITMAR